MTDPTWKNRIIIINSNENNDDYKKFINKAENHKKDFMSRKVEVYPNLTFEEDKFNMQLYGLDGGLKINWDNYESPDNIIKEIDSLTKQAGGGIIGTNTYKRMYLDYRNKYYETKKLFDMLNLN